MIQTTLLINWGHCMWLCNYPDFQTGDLNIQTSQPKFGQSCDMLTAYHLKVFVLQCVVRETFLRAFNKCQKLFSNVKTKFHEKLSVSWYLPFHLVTKIAEHTESKHTQRQLHKHSALSYSNNDRTNSCSVDATVFSGAQLLHAASSEMFVLLRVRVLTTVLVAKQ
jgi:hypothetical protein